MTVWLAFPGDAISVARRLGDNEDRTSSSDSRHSVAGGAAFLKVRHSRKGWRRLSAQKRVRKQNDRDSG
ncbi:MAG TPA: hypothetical protein VEU96_12715 [Bryobacteraceae bacterium]|nr:hypothetical protein [Bryobacteraceae bacterium]